MRLAILTYREFFHYLLHSDGLEPEVRVSWLLHIIVCHCAWSLDSLPVHRSLAWCTPTHVYELLLAILPHHIRHLGAFKLAKVEIHHLTARSCIYTGVFDASGDLMMNNRLLVFADDIDSQFKHVLLPKLMWIGVPVLLRQSSTIDKGSVGGLDVSYPNLSISISPYLGVLSRQEF